MARWAPFSAGLPLLVSFPEAGKSVAILMMVEPVVGVVELPVDVPAPQAARMANNRGIPIVKANIRDQLLFMLSSSSFNDTKYNTVFIGDIDDYVRFLK